MKTARLFDMRGGELPTNSGSPLVEIGARLVRQNPQSPNPCIMVNARTSVTVKNARGDFKINPAKLRNPILVVIYEDSMKVESFWIPPFAMGDRDAVPADENTLQLGRFSFNLPIFQE